VFIEALLRPQAWPHPVEPIELCETHISWVLLTGTYAYKIKKPLNFGFLDFSSLEKRKHFCEEEVRLNRRLAPQIYLDVVPIHGSPDSPNLCGDGPLLDYAVRMQQFDTRQGYDEMLRRDELSARHMDKTADTLAAFHLRTAVADAASGYGTPEAVLAPVQENFEEIRQQLDSQLEDAGIHQQFAMLERWSRHTWRALTPVFLERWQSGFVRECHGDLHLRNIVYWRETVIPFDCLEFSPGLRWIDVMCELAFLLMDLDDHRRQDLARRLLNAYLEITGDYAGLQVLRFYQVYRALVRAKVASLRLAQTPDPDAVEEIGNYIRLATFYTQAHKGRLVITHGLSGSGKTFVSQRILEQAEVIRLRSDVERKRLFGLSAKDSSGSGEQQGIYRTDANARTYARLLELAEGLVDWGYTVLVDAAFLRLGQRALFRDYAERRGVPFRILHCEAGAEIQRRRIVSRGEKGSDASEANLAILEWQLAGQEPLSDTECKQCISVDTSGEPELGEMMEWLNT
jgi:aminoglycoside phosphotransferase family enzyme/predicted kinase